MLPNHGDWRLDTIERLQQKLSRCTDSYFSKIYEIALDLALNHGRSVGPDFYFRVINDAKRTIRRYNNSRPSIYALYTVNSDGEEQDIDNPLLADYSTPEQHIIYRHSIELLRQACSKKHRHSIAVFYSMLEGYSVVDTAKKLGISEAMVKKLRSEIIRTAKIILLN